MTRLVRCVSALGLASLCSLAHAQGDVDLSLSLQALPGWHVQPGESATLRLTLHNAGPDLAIEPIVYVGKQLGGPNNDYIVWAPDGATDCGYVPIIGDGAPGFPSTFYLQVRFDDLAVGATVSCDVALYSTALARGTSSLRFRAWPRSTQTETVPVDNVREHAVTFGAAGAVTAPAVIPADEPLALVVLGVLGAAFGLRSLRRAGLDE